jgi:hypothetical protein
LRPSRLGPVDAAALQDAAHAALAHGVDVTALPDPVRTAVLGRATTAKLTLAEDAPAYLTCSLRLRKPEMFARLTGTADRDAEHLTALVLGTKDVLGATHGERRGTAVLAARLEDVEVGSVADLLVVARPPWPTLGSLAFTAAGGCNAGQRESAWDWHSRPDVVHTGHLGSVSRDARAWTVARASGPAKRSLVVTRYGLGSTTTGALTPEAGNRWHQRGENWRGWGEDGRHWGETDDR